MVVRVTSAASIMALAVAAWPFPAQAQESPTPSIGCTNPGGGGLAVAVIPSTVSGINWGDGFGFGAPSVSVDALPAVQFNCNAGMYSADVTGNMFSVNFGPIGSRDQKIFAGELKIELVGTQEYKEQKLDSTLNVTEFDLSVSVYKENVDGALVLDHKDFFGVKYDSAFGDALSDKSKLIFADGSVFLDPPIGGGSGTVELIATPGGPTPEPGTLALFGSGLLAAARVLRRKSRR